MKAGRVTVVGGKFKWYRLKGFLIYIHTDSNNKSLRSKNDSEQSSIISRVFTVIVAIM